MIKRYACFLLLVVLCACVSKPVVVHVGSKSNTEQMILGEILALHLEKQLPGVQIERRLGLGGTSALQSSLESGAVDVFVEEGGTMLGGVLKEDVPADAAVGLERARDQYLLRFQANVLSPLGFRHQFVVTSYNPETTKVESLSEVGGSGKGLKMGVAYDLFDRKDAFTELTTKYRISLREFPPRLDSPAMYEGLKTGVFDLAAGYSTDAWTDQPGFHVLKDDRNLFPAHPACVVVRSAALAAVPALQRALDALTGKISDDAMRKMNQAVDLRHRGAATVAREFLGSAGL